MPPDSQPSTSVAPLQSGFNRLTDFEDCQQVNPHGIEEIFNVNTLVRHGVELATRPADHAFHAQHLVEMRGISAIKSRWRNNAGGLLFTAYRLIGTVHRFNDGRFRRYFERQHGRAMAFT